MPPRPQTNRATQIFFWDQPASVAQIQIEKIVAVETQRLRDRWPTARVRRVSLQDAAREYGRQGQIHARVDLAELRGASEWRARFEEKDAEARIAIRRAFAAADEALQARR